MEVMSPYTIDLAETGSALPAPAPRMMTIPDVAARLGVGVRYVRRLVADRRIPFFKVGYLIRFDPQEVDAWLAASHIGHNA
jgi:excisionase family DNA binding protein